MPDRGGLSGQAIFARVRRRGRQAGLGDVGPHQLRASLATAMLGAGNDLSIAAAVLGHRSVATTAIYDRRGEADKARAVATVAVPFQG